MRHWYGKPATPASMSRYSLIERFAAMVPESVSMVWSDQAVQYTVMTQKAAISSAADSVSFGAAVLLRVATAAAAVIDESTNARKRKYSLMAASHDPSRRPIRRDRPAARRRCGSRAGGAVRRPRHLPDHWPSVDRAGLSRRPLLSHSTGADPRTSARFVALQLEAVRGAHKRGRGGCDRALVSRAGPVVARGADRHVDFRAGLWPRAIGLRPVYVGPGDVSPRSGDDRRSRRRTHWPA